MSISVVLGFFSLRMYMKENYGKDLHQVAKEKVEQLQVSKQLKFSLCWFYTKMVMTYAPFNHVGKGVVETKQTRYAICKKLKPTTKTSRLYKQLALLESVGLMSIDAQGDVVLYAPDYVLPPAKIKSKALSEAVAINWHSPKEVKKEAATTVQPSSVAQPLCQQSQADSVVAAFEEVIQANPNNKNLMVAFLQVFKKHEQKILARYAESVSGKSICADIARGNGMSSELYAEVNVLAQTLCK